MKAFLLPLALATVALATTKSTINDGPAIPGFQALDHGRGLDLERTSAPLRLPNGVLVTIGGEEGLLDLDPVLLDHILAWFASDVIAELPYDLTRKELSSTPDFQMSPATSLAARALHWSIAARQNRVEFVYSEREVRVLKKLEALLREREGARPGDSVEEVTRKLTAPTEVQKTRTIDELVRLTAKLEWSLRPLGTLEGMVAWQSALAIHLQALAEKLSFGGNRLQDFKSRKRSLRRLSKVARGAFELLADAMTSLQPRHIEFEVKLLARQKNKRASIPSQPKVPITAAVLESTRSVTIQGVCTASLSSDSMSVGVVVKTKKYVCRPDRLARTPSDMVEGVNLCIRSARERALSQKEYLEERARAIYRQDRRVLKAQLGEDFQRVLKGLLRLQCLDILPQYGGALVRSYGLCREAQSKFDLIMRRTPREARLHFLP